MARKKKRSTLTTAEAVARLDRMLPILRRNVINALRIEATLEAGNNVVGSMEDRSIPGAGTYNTIKQSLGYDLAMHLARLYDVGTRHRHPNERDVASIPLMVRLLRQRRCQAALRNRARNGMPENPNRLTMYERDCMAAIERASQAYSNTFKGEHGRGGLKTLKAFRDTFMAHSLLTDVEADPRYNQLFKLTDSAREFVEAARLAIDLANSSFDLSEKLFEKDATTFWEAALLGKRSGGTR
ncbi:hypothetical protein HJB99_28835 [Rhizobium sp. NLR17b]|uniref:AbiU2 domain-containing protein n=1 Tax=Rhizobium sp. NLR17b TaxID=2731114 RepID=UPI001C83F17A|nr:hypothetical protein [Rhizobium sp. NLR17b]MBX5272621.1 hypothetical protein [Rhizobium sp. NLR17b]